MIGHAATGVGGVRRGTDGRAPSTTGRFGWVGRRARGLTYRYSPADQLARPCTGSGGRTACTGGGRAATQAAAAPTKAPADGPPAAGTDARTQPARRAHPPETAGESAQAAARRVPAVIAVEAAKAAAPRAAVGYVGQGRGGGGGGGGGACRRPRRRRRCQRRHVPRPRRRDAVAVTPRVAPAVRRRGGACWRRRLVRTRDANRGRANVRHRNRTDGDNGVGVECVQIDK